MSSVSQAPVGSRWTWKGDTKGRVFVVTGRRPPGVVEWKQEGRAYSGESYLRNWLVNADRLPDAADRLAQHPNAAQAEARILADIAAA
jgi:hypothetical protein